MIFEEGFTLGLKIGKLKHVLEALVADEPVLPHKVAGTEDRTQDARPATQLGPDKLVQAVLPVAEAPAKRPDDVADVRANLSKTHETLDSILNKDYKPWCTVSHG